MERKDLLLENAKIFTEQGKALDAVASRNVKVLVVGNPGQHQRLHRDEVGAVAAEEELHRDAAPRPQPRAVAARREGRQARSATIEKLIVWGNHSPTMYPDYRFATVGGKSLKDADQRRELEPQRLHPDGRQARRGDHRGARPVVGGLGGQRRHRPRARLGRWARNGKWVTMGVPSDGSYGIPQDVMYGVPGHDGRRRVHDRHGPADRRLLAREDGRDAEGARGRARRRGACSAEAATSSLACERR